MKHSFDDQFKQAMQQAEEPLNVDKLWSQVEERTFGKRRKRWIIFTILPVLLLGAFYLGYQISNTQDKTAANNTQIETRLDQEKTNHKSQNETVTTKTAVSDKATSDLNEVTRKNNNLETTKSSSKPKKLTTKQAIKSKSNNSSSRNTNTNKQLANQPTPSSINDEQRTPSIELSVNRTIETTKPGKTMVTNANHLDARTFSNTARWLSIQGILTTSLASFPWEIRNPVSFTQEQLSAPQKKEVLTKIWQKTLVLSTSYVQTNKQLTLQDSLESAYLNLRKSTESSQESWTIAPSMQWKHASGFLVETGIHYQRINEQFNWTGTYTESDGEIYKDLLIVDQAGDTIRKASIGSTELNKTIITRNMSINNSYHQLGIMLGAGYQFRFNRLSLSPVIYGHLNALTWAGQNDYILEDTAKPGLLNQQVTNDMSLTYSGKITISYDISDKLSLGLNAQYRMVPNVLKSELPISQTYGFTGLGLALGYKW